MASTHEAYGYTILRIQWCTLSLVIHEFFQGVSETTISQVAAEPNINMRVNEWIWEAVKDMAGDI